MDDSGPQSLFLVVSWITTAVPYSTSIIQVDNNHEYASSSVFSAHFPRLSQAPRPIWLGMASSSEDLYMLLDWPCKQQSLKDDEKDGTLPGFIFNLSSKKCKLIKPPLAPKYMGHAVMLGDHVYFMAQPHYSVPNSPDPCFERYDTLSQKWETLAHLPLYTGFIEGTAVLDDTILFYINSTTSPKTLQAYNVGRNKWYPVNVLNNLCYSLVGVAVVLNQFIYGLVRESVVALTLKSQEKDGDLVFTCDLHKEYKVPGMRQKIFERCIHWTQYFVHLGKDNFCLVQSGNCSGVESQCIQLTHIELTEKNTESVVTNIFVHELKIPRGGLFMIRHCFFVPKCKTTTALKQGKGFLKFNPEQEAEIVTLPPELLPFQDGYSSQTNIIDKQVSQSRQSIDDADTKTPQVQEDVPKKSSASLVTGNQSLNDATKASTLGDDGESGRSHTGEKGHSIWVTNLPLDANLELQLYKRLKRFGPIMNLACQIDPDNTNDFLAHVEFESKTSKQKAIKASAIKVGGRKAVIKKKRGTGLTQGGSVSQTSQSRDDADTKTLQVQEDVPKKSSASVVTGHQSLNYATKASTLGDGHSICVANLPPDTNCRELFKELMRFGPIKSFIFFLIDPNNPCECCFGDVEFERATSKQNAIKASPINIGGCLAVIKEKRGTGGLTQVDSKLKKRGKVSRSKKTI